MLWQYVLIVTILIFFLVMENRQEMAGASIHPLLTLMRSNHFLRRLSAAELQLLVGSMTARTAHPGETVIRAGDAEAFYFYMLSQGEVEVWDRREGDTRDSCVAVLKEGDTFGELALWYSTPRCATLRARTKCLLWQVE